MSDTRGLLTRLAAAVAVPVLIGAAGTAGWLYWDASSTRAAQDTGVQLRKLATEEVPKVFGFDYQTVERAMMDVGTLLTPDYRREFADRAKKDIIPAARERQLVTQANVTGAGVLEAGRNSGSVLVFLNRTVTDKSKQSSYDGSRLRVDYQRVDGDWLISYIAPI